MPVRLRLISESLLLVLVVALPISVQAGFFAKLFSNNQTEQTSGRAEQNLSAIDTPLLTALQNPNPMGARGGADIVVDDNVVLVSTGPVGADIIAEQKNNSGEIRVYTVREGDSLSQVAEMFGVTTNTIMWANDINRATEIQPGDTLVILPIVGVQHEIKKGDTMNTIAKKYEGNIEEILAYNQLVSEDQLAVGDTIIIPGGAMHAAPVRVTGSASPVSVSGVSSVASSFVHPAPGSVRTQGIHGYNGVDLAGTYGSAVRAAASGEVIVSKSSGWNGGYGQYVVIKHADGTQTLYAHLSSNSVGVGAYVSAGETIGGMGNSGRSTGTHLHFEVRGTRNPF